MDSVSKEERSGIMRLIKSRETRLEKVLRSRLWKHGIRYRKNNSSLFGNPDISISNKKVVIFVDSCFWHGCEEHLRMPRSNMGYWVRKIEKNKKRDQVVNAHYIGRKWSILRYWEHRIRTEVESVVVEVFQAVNRKNHA